MVLTKIRGAWKTAKLKPYNFKAMGAPAMSGALHPCTNFDTLNGYSSMLMSPSEQSPPRIPPDLLRNGIRRDAYKQVMLSPRPFLPIRQHVMLTTASPLNRYVETGFWNFDALFIPQQHPARDQQDTFFISDPPVADLPRADPPAASSQTLPNGSPSSTPADKTATSSTSTPKDPKERPLDYDAYFKAISTVHSTGSHNSIGYRAPFSVAESQRLVLRTHTTAISTYMLYHL